MSKDSLAAVVENDRDVRAKMYEAIQRDHQKRSPFAVMFQKIEQTGRSNNVQNLKSGRRYYGCLLLGPLPSKWPLLLIMGKGGVSRPFFPS